MVLHTLGKIVDFLQIQSEDLIAGPLRPQPRPIITDMVGHPVDCRRWICRKHKRNDMILTLRAPLKQAVCFLFANSEGSFDYS